MRNWIETRDAYGAINVLTLGGFWRSCVEAGEDFALLDYRIEARLHERLRPAIEQLEDLAPRDLAAWKLGRRGAPTVAL